MYASSSHWSLSKTVFVFLLLFCSCRRSVEPPEQAVEKVKYIKVDTVETISKIKLDLTKEYCSHYYGISTNRLENPKMVVIHHTVIPTLKETIELLKRDKLASNRAYINQFSSLNVGIHYVVDKDGAIYNLMPDTVIARHIIGFNHVSIGIENVAKTENDLTSSQLASNIKLVRFLAERHLSIEYLIGHDEYNDDSLPHYALFKSLDSTYMPYDKPDPGVKFMRELRSGLNSEYGLVFKK